MIRSIVNRKLANCVCNHVNRKSSYFIHPEQLMHIYKQKQAQKLCKYLESEREFLKSLGSLDNNSLDTISMDIKKEVEIYDVKPKVSKKKFKFNLEPQKQSNDIEDSVSLCGPQEQNKKFVKTNALKTLLKKKCGIVDNKLKTTDLNKKSTILPIILNTKKHASLMNNLNESNNKQIPIYLKKLQKINKIHKINQEIKELSRLKSGSNTNLLNSFNDSISIRSLRLNHFKEDDDRGSLKGDCSKSINSVILPSTSSKNVSEKRHLHSCEFNKTSQNLSKISRANINSLSEAAKYSVKMKYQPLRIRYQIGSDSQSVLALLNSGETKNKHIVDSCSKYPTPKSLKIISKSKENTCNRKLKTKFVELDD